MSRLIDRMSGMKNKAENLSKVNEGLENLVESLAESNNRVSSFLEGTSYEEEEDFLFEGDFDEDDAEYNIFEDEDDAEYNIFEDEDDAEYNIFEDEDDAEHNIFESEDDAEHNIFESEDDAEHNIFESEDDAEHNIFEGEYMEGRDLGTITTHDGRKISYSVIEEGQRSPELQSVLKQFRDIKANKSNILMEAVYEFALMEARGVVGSGSGVRVTGKKKHTSYAKNMDGSYIKNTDGKRLKSSFSTREYRSGNRGGKNKEGKNTNPELAIKNMAEQKGVNQIFSYNRRLKKKLTKLEKEVKSEVNNKFVKAVKENISWIYVDMKQVIDGISSGSLSKLDSSLSESLTSVSSEIKKALGKSVDNVGVLVAAAIGDMKGGDEDLAKEGIASLKASGQGMLDKMQEAAGLAKKKRAADPRSTQELSLATKAKNKARKMVFLLEAVYESANFNNKFKKNGDLKKGGSNKDRAFDQLDINIDNAGVIHLIDMLGDETVSSLAYGLTTGAFGFTFFLGMQVANGGNAPGKSLKRIEEIRNARALTGKLAHDLKWVSRFERAGLLGATIESSEQDKDGKFKKIKIPKGEDVAGWLKSHSSDISTIMSVTAPKKVWLGHPKFGKKTGGTDAQKNKRGKTLGREVKQNDLLEGLDLFFQLIF